MQPAELVTLERSLSVERLGPYRRAARGNLAAAMRLYEWNAEVSSALGTSLGHLEVLLRNALHDELTAWSTSRFSEPRWYVDPGRVLSPEAVQDVAKARGRVTRAGRPESPGRVVAELNLGFWRFLLAARYDGTLWRYCLYRNFPGQRRRTVHDAVARLHDARNRMAHHEPMFNRPIGDLHASVLRVAGWICPVGEAWISGSSRVPALLAQRP